MSCKLFFSYNSWLIIQKESSITFKFKIIFWIKFLPFSLFIPSFSFWINYLWLYASLWYHYNPPNLCWLNFDSSSLTLYWLENRIWTKLCSCGFPIWIFTSWIKIFSNIFGLDLAIFFFLLKISKSKPKKSLKIEEVTDKTRNISLGKFGIFGQKIFSKKFQRFFSRKKWVKTES